MDYGRSNLQGVAGVKEVASVRRIVSVLAVAALVAAITVVVALPALGDQSDGCKGINKAIAQQKDNPPEGVNDNLFDKAVERGCIKGLLPLARLSPNGGEGRGLDPGPF
jgi:hypothetical protein